MTPDAIELLDITKAFGRERLKAVNDVSLTIRAGEFVALQGTSGSGKSTLLNIMAGLERPDEGSVIIAGEVPKTRKQWERIRSDLIGIVFQSFHLISTLTASENVEIPLFGRESSSRKRQAMASEMLERVGLQNRAKHVPAELSGGERQRVAIARSLINSPHILLADEPTGNLDSNTAAEILALIREIHVNDCVSVVLVTHDRDIAALADRVVFMKDGSLQ